MIKLTLNKEQAEYLRDVLQNPLLDEPHDLEPSEHSVIREHLWSGLNECLSGDYSLKGTKPEDAIVDFEALNKLMVNQTAATPSIKQQCYLAVLNGLLASGGVHYDTAIEQASSIANEAVKRLYQLGEG